MSSAAKKQRIDRFLAVHRDRGLPVTTQRRAVFEAILDRTDHPTAEQLYRAVRRQLPQISLMTVHRILGTLVSVGLAARICHPGSVARFDPKLGQHHHLVCLDCGRIRDVEEPRLNRVPWPEIDSREFRIEDYHIHFRGRCARCLRGPVRTKQSRVASVLPAPRRLATRSKKAQTQNKQRGWRRSAVDPRRDRSQH